MTDNHPITPPPELVQQWYDAARGPRCEQELATQAARWGRPAPVAEGEVAELVARLRAIRNDYGVRHSADCRRAADLLEQRQAAPVPVPVGERSDQIEDLAADAVGALRYIEQSHGRLYGVGWDRVYEKADRLQPHALPLPSGEVDK